MPLQEDWCSPSWSVRPCCLTQGMNQTIPIVWAKSFWHLEAWFLWLKHGTKWVPDCISKRSQLIGSSLKECTQHVRERRRERERERHRDTETERQRDREPERQRDRETERRDTETQRQRDRETESQRDRETERQRDRETERQRDRETERQKDRETERQRDRETERQRDGERERASERGREGGKGREREAQSKTDTTKTQTDDDTIHAGVNTAFSTPQASSCFVLNLFDFLARCQWNILEHPQGHEASQKLQTTSWNNLD